MNWKKNVYSGGVYWSKGNKTIILTTESLTNKFKVIIKQNNFPIGFPALFRSKKEALNYINKNKTKL